EYARHCSQAMAGVTQTCETIIPVRPPPDPVRKYRSSPRAPTVSAASRPDLRNSALQGCLMQGIELIPPPRFTTRRLLSLGTPATFFAATAKAQDKPISPDPQPTISLHAADNPAHKFQDHKFWDKENALLFAGVGAARTLDYFSTLNMRSR